ncbi:hypothetical protein [Sorangium sp. So ce693]|uniref:hypothetical protein n=1 Tax=Sorangium sp. So ce693 TaxID=3133318 RepID=UPI003F609D04
MELGTRRVRVFAADGGAMRARLRAIRDVHGNELRLEYEGERLVAETNGAGEGGQRRYGVRDTRPEARRPSEARQP